MANYKQVDLFFVKKYNLIVSRDKKNQDNRNKQFSSRANNGVFTI